MKAVDVLAVLDDLPTGSPALNPIDAEALREARAAVAELIAMAEIADQALSAHGIALSRGDGLTIAAALARVGGAA